MIVIIAIAIVISIVNVVAIVAIVIVISIVNVVVAPFNLLNLYFFRKEGWGRGWLLDFITVQWIWHFFE